MTLLCLGSLALWLLLQYIVINRMNHWARGKDWDVDQIGVYVMTTFISAILFGGMFLATLKDTIMVWFAPKIFIIEHIVNLIKH